MNDSHVHSYIKQKRSRSNSVSQKDKLYQLTDEIKSTSKKYGLCVFNFARALVSPSGGYYECPERYFEYYSLSHLVKGSGRLWMSDVPERRIAPA